eukprot:2225350-Pyramimonas_sp.AAC.1
MAKEHPATKPLKANKALDTARLYPKNLAEPCAARWNCISAGLKPSSRPRACNLDPTKRS